MKRLSLFLLLVLITTTSIGQVYKTINTTAGTLSSKLGSISSPYSLTNTITNLTITGTINAQDFAHMQFNMPNLAVLDISSVTISSYNGSGGPNGSSTLSYPGNEIPAYSFYNGSIFKGKTSLKTIILPNSINSIGLSAFGECSGLTSIVLPSSTISIGELAFYKCDMLSSITIPNSVSSIGANAFNGCSSLINIILPTSLTSISNGIFSNCYGLKNVTFGNALKTIGDKAFYYCYQLKDIALPNSVLTIGSDAFNSSGLTKLTLGSELTSIGKSAFCNCDSLGLLNIGNKVDVVGVSAFQGCQRLVEVIIPNSVTLIGDHAFSNCDGLTNLIIGSNVKTIGSYAFSTSIKITSLTIPNSITSIGDYAFSGCSGLTNLSIGSGVNSIGSSAFGDCIGLRKIYSNTISPVVAGPYLTLMWSVDKSACILYIPAGSLDSYKAAKEWQEFKSIIIIGLPTIITNIDTNNITNSTASSGGSVTDAGTSAVISRGICWDLIENPTITNSKTIDGIGVGTFISSITGLTKGTTYHVRAYATNSVGTSYGNDLMFTTTNTNTNTTSVPEMTLNNLSVYPNPTKDIIVVDIENANKLNYSINISNVLGNRIYSAKLISDKTNIDLSQFGSKGVYFVQIINENGLVIGSKKVILQ